jgi:hypothetical protein
VSDRDLPLVPREAVAIVAHEIAGRWTGPGAGAGVAAGEILDAVWPVLYATALRHAPDPGRDNGLRARIETLCDDWTRRYGNHTPAPFIRDLRAALAPDPGPGPGPDRAAPVQGASEEEAREQALTRMAKEIGLEALAEKFKAVRALVADGSDAPILRAGEDNQVVWTVTVAQVQAALDAPPQPGPDR